MEQFLPFGDLVRRHRMALGLTQDELACRVGCSRETVRKIEAGKRRPSPPMAERFAQFLAVDPQLLPHFLLAARHTGSASPLPVASFVLDEHATTWEARLPLPQPLIGREREIQALEALVLRPDLRLLNLVGLPGVGKTQTALTLIAQLRATFDGTVCFVPLAPLCDPAALPAAILTAVGVPPRPDQPLPTQLRAALHERNLLLVLDNLEHLAEATPLIGSLLQDCPGLRILVTSRVVLQLRGEQVYPLEPLDVPQHGHGLPLPALAEVPAVALFVRRAQEARADFQLDERNAAAVAAICAAVGGLPLALELAAAWVRTLSCADIAGELARSQELLVSRRRDVPERQRSMQAALAASWALLPEPERVVIERLAVLRGSFDRATAAGVAGASLTSLATLIDHSLLQQDDNGRYRLHKLVRRYAEQRLCDAQLDTGCREDRAFYMRRNYAGIAGWPCSDRVV